MELFERGLLDTFEVGTFRGLAQIHKYLFDEIYDFAGQLRTVNIAKGNFRFAPVLYLEAALEKIGRMPQGTFDEIIEKYVEMNIAHPFREGNGRSTRLWLGAIRDTEIKALLREALTDRINDRQMYMKGVDASYRYEGYNTYKTEDMKKVTPGRDAR